MREVAGADAAQPTSGRTDLTDAVKIEVADSSDVLQALTDFAVALEYDETVDQGVNAATITFRRDEGVNSFAPLMTATPPVAIGRRFAVSIDPGSGDYREVIRGRIDAVRWPARFGDVTCECRDQAGRAADTWIEDAVEYGSTAGVSLETVMQAVVDDNLDSAPTLEFPSPTSAVVIHEEGDKPYEPTEQTVLDALKTLAESFGGTIRWRNFDDTADDWRWTVFAPSRTKTVPDHTFGPEDYWDVTVMDQELTDIRNVIEVEYSGAGGTVERVQYPLEENVETDPSVMAYGRRYMRIVEGSGSPINNATMAFALARAAYSDLSEPDAILEITCRYFWPGEVGVDLYAFTANNVHFSSTQTLAPMAFTHRIAIGERPTTKILCRGKPSGGMLMWQRKQRAVTPTVPQTPDILRVTFTDTTTERTYTVTVGPRVNCVHVWHRTVSATETDDPLDFSEDAAIGDTPSFQILAVAPGTNTVSVTISHPSRGYRVAGRFVPFDVPSTGPREGASWPFVIDPAPEPVTAQGTVSIDTNGAWAATADGPPDTLSFRWSSSTSSYPADATVAASGTLVTGTGRLLAISGGAALTFGQTIYVTIVPFNAVSGGGEQMPSLHLRGSYQTFTATKTTTFSGAIWHLDPETSEQDVFLAGAFVANGDLSPIGMGAPLVQRFVAHPVLPNGVTVTSVAFDVADDAGADFVTAEVDVFFARLSGTSETVLGNDSATSGGGWQTLTLSMSESTTGRTYLATAIMSGGTSTTVGGELQLGAIAITYTSPDPSRNV